MPTLGEVVRLTGGDASHLKRWGIDAYRNDHDTYDLLDARTGEWLCQVRSLKSAVARARAGRIPTVYICSACDQRKRREEMHIPSGLRPSRCEDCWAQQAARQARKREAGGDKVTVVVKEAKVKKPSKRMDSQEVRQRILEALIEQGTITGAVHYTKVMNGINKEIHRQGIDLVYRLSTYAKWKTFLDHMVDKGILATTEHPGLVKVVTPERDPDEQRAEELHDRTRPPEPKVAQANGLHQIGHDMDGMPLYLTDDGKVVRVLIEEVT